MNKIKEAVIKADPRMKGLVVVMIAYIGIMFAVFNVGATDQIDNYVETIDVTVEDGNTGQKGYLVRQNAVSDVLDELGIVVNPQDIVNLDLNYVVNDGDLIQITRVNEANIEEVVAVKSNTINTTGYISTFDLVQLLKEEHKANRIPIVMLSKTVHQMYHNNDDMYIPAQMCFGYWVELLQKYNRGITLNIARKVINYIDRSINDNDNLNSAAINDLMGLRENIEGWGRYNEYGDTRRIGVIDVNNNYNQYYTGYPYLEG